MPEETVVETLVTRTPIPFTELCLYEALEVDADDHEGPLLLFRGAYYGRIALRKEWHTGYNRRYWDAAAEIIKAYPSIPELPHVDSCGYIVARGGGDPEIVEGE